MTFYVSLSRLEMRQFTLSLFGKSLHLFRAVASAAMARPMDPNDFGTSCRQRHLVAETKYHFNFAKS